MTNGSIPTPGTNANREIAQIITNFIRCFVWYEMLNYAQEVVTKVYNPRTQKVETKGERLRQRLQLRRVFGEVNFTALYDKLRHKAATPARWTKDGICDSFYTEVLRFVFGDHVIDALFPDARDVLAKGELMRLKNSAGGSPQLELNKDFFATHNLDVEVFISKMRACINNPQGEFPAWLRQHRGWGDVLLTTPPY
eukprot:CAMPEP_0197610552 /NCGR_PEP_ID=MMETSP1326-20131121/53618_1 /TAXON_ID=1155430 /ORGANISM="Genus nov. species nov., Strain RCC2288" /LENGTH=195 /DNA_ID=CAMNT_0043179081 /DNA_START=57 /DNA_END=641 /DNA_ORIENTATION=-